MNRDLLEGILITTAILAVYEAVDLHRAMLDWKTTAQRIEHELTSIDLYLAGQYRPTHDGWTYRHSIFAHLDSDPSDRFRRIIF